MVSEVSVLLEDYLAKMQRQDADYQANPMLVKAMEYAQRFSAVRNKDTLQKMRE